MFILKKEKKRESSVHRLEARESVRGNPQSEGNNVCHHMLTMVQNNIGALHK